MGFTSFSLLVPETVMTAEVYLESKDWKTVRCRVFEDNLLQRNTKSGIASMFKVIRRRLEVMTSDQVDLLPNLSILGQAALVFSSIFKIHRFIYDFCNETIREKASKLDFSLNSTDYRLFFEEKKQNHPELDALSQSSEKKIRQVMFRMLAEGGFIKSTKDTTITPFLLDDKVAHAITHDSPALLRGFLMREEDIERMVSRFKK
jgi:hypothetical protein